MFKVNKLMFRMKEIFCSINEKQLFLLKKGLFYLVVVELFCVHKLFFWLCFGFCFLFGLLFGVCLVVVDVNVVFSMLLVVILRLVLAPNPLVVALKAKTQIWKQPNSEI